MLKYTLKKLLLIIPMLFVISVLVFFAMTKTNADPINYLIPADVVLTPENLAAMRAKYGLDQPVYIQYFNWISHVLQGDFGVSIVTGIPVATIIADHLPATFELALGALLISTVIGITLGVLSAIYQNSAIDYIGRFITVLGISIPQFFFGIIMILIFAIKLGVLPVGGRVDPSCVTFADRFKYLVLPTLTMSISLISTLLKYTRNSMLEVLNKDYIKVARMKGIPEWKVYFKHALRNSLKPVMVLLVFRLPMLISGSVVIEAVFSWPGIGTQIVAATTSGDYPVIMITTLLIATAILLASVLLDVLTAWLDPRVRLGD